MARRLAKLLLNVTLVSALALAASSCGRRGNLEAPPNASVVSIDDSGATQQEEEVEKVDEPFILDPLL